MALSEIIALFSAGVCLMTGLLTGVWKYFSIMKSPQHQAPVYVDIAHRASLMYAFACIVLLEFAKVSDLSECIEALSVALPIIFFLIAIFTYILLGIGNTTDNQFRERNFTTTWGMYLLIAGEIGGFALLMWGAIRTLI